MDTDRPTKQTKKHTDRIKKWQQNSPEGFLSWLEDVKPRVLQNSQYEIFIPTDEQLYLIHQILKPSENATPTLLDEPVKQLGERAHNSRKARPSRKPKLATEKPKLQHSNFQHTLSLLIMPRRHGKSTIFALICLWIATTRPNQTVQLLGSTESHTRRTMFSVIKKIIDHTPILKKLIPEKDSYVFELFCRRLGSVIQMSPGTNVATAYGDRFTIMWTSDLHSAPDLESFNAMQAALLDSKDSLLLIDSNVDSLNGHVHLMQQEAESDPSMFCYHKEYKDIEDYCENAPEWISRTKARRLQKTTLKADFKRDILGKRSSASNALFPSDVIEMCKSPYRMPVDDIRALTQGRAYKVGGGLDRSKSLLGIGGDSTIWTTVLKIANPHNEEPEFFILNQKNVIPNTANNIKKIILADHNKYKLDNVVLENFETMDLKAWIDNQNIPCELVSPHSTVQNSAFPELCRIAKEGRLHFPEDNKKLISEMSTFSYTKAPKGEGYSFGHSTRSQHDDTVFSLLWAVFSLRSQIMNLYTLNHIHCNSKRPNRHLCFLLNGNMELHCSETCEAAIEVNEMYTSFLKYQLDSELTLPDFYKTHVKLTGTRIYQAL